MALKIKFDRDDTGDTYAKAYAKVSQIIWTPGAVSVRVDVYRDADAAGAGKLPVGSMDFGAADRPAVEGVPHPIDPKQWLVEPEPAVTTFSDYFGDELLAGGGKSLGSQAYTFLKETRPEFASAVDV